MLLPVATYEQIGILTLPSIWVAMCLEKDPAVLEFRQQHGLIDDFARLADSLGDNATRCIRVRCTGGQGRHNRAGLVHLE